MNVNNNVNVKDIADFPPLPVLPPARAGMADLPPAPKSMGKDSRVPPLPLPGALNLETLMEALGGEERRQAVRDGLSTLDARSKERAEINKKQLEEIQKNLENLKARSVLDGFLKVFKIIGMIFGIIASAALTAVGAVTGNPALVAAGVLGMWMVLDAVASEASDGKVGLGPGFIAGKIAEAAGDTKAAQWVKFALDMGMALLTCALGMGAGAASAGAGAASTAARAASLTGRISQAGQAVNSVAAGAAQGAAAVYDYRITSSRAGAKEWEAMLLRIAQAEEMDLNHLKSVMERSQNLISQVSEMVGEAAQTQRAVLAGTPAMA